MTAAEAAKALGVTDSRIRQLCDEGVIQGEKRAGVWLISRAEVEKYRATRRPRGRPRKSD